MLVPHQSQPNDLPHGLPNSADLSNSLDYAAQDQYQYPTQPELFRDMAQNLEATSLLNSYREQGNPYLKEQPPSSPAANDGIRYGPDSQMGMVKYHNNNTMSEYAPVPGYEMQAPSQGYPKQEDDLDQQALRAKKDAEAKRKQIPPFVQKLSR